MRLRPENGEYEEIMVSADEVRLRGRVVYMVHSPRRGPSGDESCARMGSVLELISSLLSYVAFTGAGGLAGYFFVRRRTEHEVGYGRRVEIAERIQDSVSSAAEELMAAREYVSRTGPFDGAPAKRIGRILDDLEEY